VKSRVSSTVTKRKPNPRPRKYASASERQAAYRDRAPEVCFRAEPKTVETLDRIAADLDVSRADLLLSMTKFALTNHDWARFGLTHKPLPFGYGTQDETRKENPVKSVTLDKAKGPNGYFYRLEKRGKGYDVLINSTGYAWRYLEKGVSEQKARDRFYLETMKRKENPTMKTTTKRTPTPAQLAARERFAEAARSGAFKKAGASRRKANPAPKGQTFYIHANLGYGKTAHFKVTTSPGANSVRSAANQVANHLGYPVFVGSRNERPMDGYPVVRFEFIDDAQTKAVDLFAYQVKREGVKYSTIRKTNPAKPAAGRMGNPADEYTYSVDMEGVGKSGLFMTKAVFKTAQDAKQYARALAKSYPSRTIRVMSGGRWIKR